MPITIRKLCLTLGMILSVATTATAEISTDLEAAFTVAPTAFESEVVVDPEVDAVAFCGDGQNCSTCCEPSCCCEEPSCCCEPDCACDASCGCEEPGCACVSDCCSEPTCGCEPDCACQPDCGCEPTCGCEPGCACEPSCDTSCGGCDIGWCTTDCCDEPTCGCDDVCCDDVCCGAGVASGGGCLFGDCDLGEPCTLKGLLVGDDCAIDFGGWTQIGYHNNPTPLGRAFDDGGSFNNVPDQVNLHQQWFWAEKAADGSRGLDFGFRFDAMYGTDASKTNSFGNDSPVWDASEGFQDREYGFAMPQAYGEIAIGDFSVIAGHFYTLVGYEVVTAPDNFFYSHSLTMFNSEPFTHTGALATYSGIENLEVYAGWTLGWDTGFDQANGGSSFLGGFSAALSEDIAVTYISTAGNFGARSNGENGYSHSVVVDVTLSDSLNYVFQTDFLAYDETQFAAGTGGGNDQAGINQYLFYTVNDCLALGSRFEWWKSDGQSFCEVTYGMNYKPCANVVIRPEARIDWTPTTGGYGNGTDNQTTFGIDGIFTF